MAILYGTQSNGETLPVQVNEYGQLVAQPLPGTQGPPGEQGPQGPTGEQGPQGPPGQVEWNQWTWTPEYDFSNTASAWIEYQDQVGLVTWLNGFIIVEGYISTSNLTVLAGGGAPRVRQTPLIQNTALTLLTGGNLTLRFASGWKDVYPIGLSFSGNTSKVRILKSDGNYGNQGLDIFDMREQAYAGGNLISFQYSGFAPPEMSIERFDEYMRAFNAETSA